MNDVIVTNYTDREAWLAARRHGIGASESAALFGLSPWHSELSLWSEKTGVVEPKELEGEWLKWGHLLEEPIAREYAQQTGRVIWQAGSWAIAQHPRVSCMFSTPDRWVIEAPDKPGRGVLQIKNTAYFKAEDWEDGPPPHVAAQVQHELAVTGFAWGSIAVLIGGNRFAHWDVEREPEYIEELETRCVEFWHMVEHQKMPEIDGSPHTARTIRKLHPKDDGSAVRMPKEATSWWDQLDAAKAAKKAAEATIEQLDTQLRAAVGNATFGLLSDGRLLSLRHREVKGFTSVVAPRTERRWKLEKKLLDPSLLEKENGRP